VAGRYQDIVGMKALKYAALVWFTRHDLDRVHAGLSVPSVGDPSLA
jgi:hypothetical protein